MENDIITMQIEQAKGGDEQALAALIARQMPQIRSLAAQSRCRGLDFDDLVQEGLIGFFSALETYDAEKGVRFATYARACVQNAVASAVRAAGRNKHMPLNTSVPYSEYESIPGPEELFVENERYCQTMQSIDTRLSHMEKQVLSLFLEGSSYAQIAKRLCVNEKAVDNALQRVRAKLK